MAAPTISSLPEAPNRQTDSPSEFSTKAESFVAALPTFRTEANAVGQFSEDVAAAVSGIGVAFYQSVDLSGTADSDPGSGNIRFDSATQTSATELYLDDNNLAGDSVRDQIAKFDATGSGQTVKGDLSLRKRDDHSKWLIFEVTGVTQKTGYTVVSVQSGDGPSSSPFADTDVVVVGFVRAGDKGDAGSKEPWRVSDVGTVSTNQTLDLSTNTYLKAEPTADITIDITNLDAGSGDLRGGVVLLTGGGDHTISWSVGGGGTVNWVGGSAPSLATGTGRDLIGVMPISSTEVLLSLIQGDF
jgi:hypothetical protein